MGVKCLIPREIIRILEANGWHFDRQNGSHKVFKKAGCVKNAVFPDHGKPVSPGVMRSLYKATGLEDFLK